MARLLYGSGMRLMELLNIAKRLRYSHDAGIARTFGCEHDNDLYACSEQGWFWRGKPFG